MSKKMREGVSIYAWVQLFFLWFVALTSDVFHYKCIKAKISPGIH